VAERRRRDVLHRRRPQIDVGRRAGCFRIPGVWRSPSFVHDALRGASGRCKRAIFLRCHARRAALSGARTNRGCRTATDDRYSQLASGVVHCQEVIGCFALKTWSSIFHVPTVLAEFANRSVAGNSLWTCRPTAWVLVGAKRRAVPYNSGIQSRSTNAAYCVRWTRLHRRLVLRVAYWPAASTNSKVRVLLMSICKLIPPFGPGLDIVIG